MATNKKLELNTKYLLFTKYNTIPGLEVEVVGLINQQEAKDLPFSITNLAINEKVVDSEDTDVYLIDQLYFKCIYKDEDNNETIYLVWDDIIDEIRTTRLSVQYKYNLLLDVDTGIDVSLNTVIESVASYIGTNFGPNIRPTITSLGIVSDELTTDDILNQYKEQLEICKTVLNKLASLKQIETLINYFAKDDMIEKIKTMSDQLTNIQDTMGTISDLIS